MLPLFKPGGTRDSKKYLTIFNQGKNISLRMVKTERSCVPSVLYYKEDVDIMKLEEFSFFRPSEFVKATRVNTGSCFFNQGHHSDF